MLKKARSYLLVSVLLFLTACNNNNQVEYITQDTTPLNQVALKPIQNCTALKDKLVDNWVENLLSFQRYTPDQFIGQPIESVLDGGLSSAIGDVADSAPDEVSQTNTQETGVDEADRVKTDSQGNLYIAHHDQLLITDAWPAQSMTLSSSLNLGGPVAGLYLSEPDQLVIALVRTPFPTTNNTTTTLAPYTWWNSKTDLVFIDITDKEQPSINRRIRLDGELISSRGSNGRLHLVQSFYLDRFIYASNETVQKLLIDYHRAYVDENDDEMFSIKGRLRSHVLQNLDVDDITELLPTIQYIDDSQQTPVQALACDDLYAPIIDIQQNHLLVVTSIDINGDNIDRAAAIGNGWIVYASEQDLFIVQPGYSWWWRPHQLQQSAIHHFSLSDQKPVYLSTGLIKGFINNSFSLSYFENHLRVVTTQNFWNLSDLSDIRSTNHLFVLEDNINNGMDITGSVENYADNERIYSARFIKDKGFVVTFRQIDPLFSFELSDPKDPFIAGELKIPGFSSYMHPIDDNHLLTIGRDGDDNGANTQVAIKLFDVSDLANPLLIGGYTPELLQGYSWSQANWDHHAFTYYQPEQLLAIPLSSYHAENNDYFMGMLLLNVDPEQGLSLAGKVDHQDLLPQITCSNTFTDCDTYYYRWLSQPTRSIFMTQESDSYFYSLSNIGLKAVDIDDLETTVGSLLLPSPESYYDLYY